MASIWTQGPGCEPHKLEGHIKADPQTVERRLNHWTSRLAKANKAAVLLSDGFERTVRWPDGKLFTVYAEFLSPPSAEEPFQPKRKIKQ